MDVLADSFKGEWLGHLVTLIAPLVGFGAASLFALREYHRKMTADGRALASAYIATIEVTIASFRQVKRDEYFFKASAIEIPEDAVYDFRREDWFSVHHGLCQDLGKLIYLNKKEGQEAILLISTFFQEFKYSRELFAYFISLQKAAAIQRKNKEQSIMSKSNESHIEMRVNQIDSQLEKLIGIGDNTIKKLRQII